MIRQHKFLNQHRKVMIEYNSIRFLYKTEPIAADLLEKNLPKWVSERLKENIMESLRGFSFDMAIEIAVSVSNCAQYGQCEFTCLPYIDRLLTHHYNAILHEAEQKCIKIKNYEKKYRNERDW